MAAAISLIPSLAAADDWVVTKLRGSVAVLVGESWQPLRRGDVIADDRAIQTLSGSRATLERRLERIELGPDTAIRIDDATASKYTTVNQYFGSVTVEAEVQNVEHFGVLTPHLAAVVKGTRFTVVSNQDSASVSVLHGRVAVEDSDTHQTTLLAVGQSASTSNGGAPLTISGKGTLPAVYGADGKPVSNDLGKAKSAAVKEAGAAARAAALAGGSSAKEADRAAKVAERAARSDKKEANNGTLSNSPANPGSSGNGGGSDNSSNGNNSGGSGGGNDSSGGNSGKGKD